MSTTTTVLLIGAAAVAGWWMFLRKSYFVERHGTHPYEYFDDLGAARAYSRKTGGALYEIAAGSEFDDKSAVRMTPNRSRARSRKQRRATRQAG